MSKGKTKGRYICKVGFYDIYAKDVLKSSKGQGGVSQILKTDYDIYHSRKLTKNGFKTKELAVKTASELMEKHSVKA